jgi:hypothetical protein
MRKKGGRTKGRRKSEEEAKEKAKHEEADSPRSPEYTLLSTSKTFLRLGLLGRRRAG